ncbi:MFS transporter, partial [Ralstonia sp. RL]|uniref:MFS transporter n=1 Tax=Ralstonia sp. RL TaxID=1839756 RepID=UPI00257BD738
MSAAHDRMTPEERRTGASLASIFALRMLGLFLILPVFSVHAKTLPGGDDLALVGFALGAYGLTQACFQIPYGVASDYFGRKQVIVAGLILFALGSFVAAWAPDMTWIIVGRVLQGAGAISAAVTALAADLTREQHRTKVMAMIGSSIGLVFALSLVGAPVLYGWIGMSGLFVLTGVLALAAIGLLLKAVPPAPAPHGHEKLPLRRVLFDADLLRLNLGIFTLHMVQMAMFVVLPHALVDFGGLPAAAHWQVYLPAVLVSFVVMVPAIIAAERKDRMRPVFLAAVGLLVVVQLGLYLLHESLELLALWLLLFFVAFNVLEATLPSLVSRTAPPAAKGAALGVYNTT